MNLLPEAQALMAGLRQDIPLTAALQVRAEAYNGQHLVLAVPFAPNINDKGTAFAGSIAALANLTGWALLTLWAEERFGAVQVAVYHSDIHYRKPLVGDFRASVHLPEPHALADAEAALEAGRRAKLALTVELSAADGVAAVMQGKYALWLADIEQ